MNLPDTPHTAVRAKTQLEQLREETKLLLITSESIHALEGKGRKGDYIRRYRGNMRLYLFIFFRCEPREPSIARIDFNEPVRVIGNETDCL